MHDYQTSSDDQNQATHPRISQPVCTRVNAVQSLSGPMIYRSHLDLSASGP